MSPTTRQRAFYFDQRYCTACHACQMACKDLNDLPVGVNWRRVYTFEYGRYPRPRVYHLTIACSHCARPLCAEACPVGAIGKRHEDGVVLLDSSLCTGCRACIGACPYQAPQFDERTAKVGKCDFCFALLHRGEEPACVSACTMRVLHAGWLDEMTDGQELAGRDLPDPGLAVPSVRVTRHRDAHGRRD